MNCKLTKKQMKLLNAYVKEITENDSYKLTMQDRLIIYFVNQKPGIIENGVDMKQITRDFGLDYNRDYREVCYFRTNMSTFQRSMQKDGLPFGSGYELDKDGKRINRLKNYGWIDGKKELNMVERDLMKLAGKVIFNCASILSEDNPIKKDMAIIANKISKQLEFDFSE